MRRAARKDANHDEMVAAFRALGCYVVETHREGGGIPDLFVRYLDAWYPVEVKSPVGYYGKELSESQKRFELMVGQAIPIVRTTHDVEALFKKWQKAR